MNAVRQDSACQIYLRIAAGEAPSRSDIESIVQAVQPAALLVTGAGEAFSEAGGLVKFAKSQNIAVLLDDHLELVKQFDADGIHMRAPNRPLSDIRSFLGDEKSIGVSCALSRHDSMTMAELGADYIALGELLESDEAALDDLASMIRWWNEIFEIPCVAWLGAEGDERGLQCLIEAGADFVCVDIRFWSGADGGQRLSSLPDMLRSKQG